MNHGCRSVAGVGIVLLLMCSQANWAAGESATPRLPVVLDRVHNAAIQPMRAIAAADFDSDGVVDLAAIATVDGQRELLSIRSHSEQLRMRGDQPGLFVSPTSVRQIPATAAHLLSSDLNADGRADLLIAGADQGLWWAAGDGEGGFEAPQPLPVEGRSQQPP